MKRLGLALLLAACNSTALNVAAGEFTAPSGLAVTSAGDRDLLFIANEGRDNLRALQICSLATLADGGVDPADTCTNSGQDLQFVPAPIRVFPATIETANRPRRLAGVRLSRPDQTRTGLVLAVGADSTLRVVDARNLVEAVNGKAAAPVLSLALPAPAVDVVAENPLDGSGVEISAPAGQAATAFVATVGGGSAPAQLLMLSAGLDAQGNATLPTITGKCSLGAVVPRKLAVVPGGGDRVYVADGAGDGVVSVAKTDIHAPSDPPAACVMDRIGAGLRSVRSVAVSPPWYDLGLHPAGELLIMILEPLAASTAGTDLDPGGILIVRTKDKAIVPIPPSDVLGATAGLQPMEPISTPGLPSEVAFLRAIPPDATCPDPPTDPTATPGACTPVYVTAPLATPVARFNLLAAVSSTTGETYFVDVLKRRFVTKSYYTGVDGAGTVQDPLNSAAPFFSPSTSDPNPPTFTFLDKNGAPVVAGGFTAGITQTSQWRVAFRAAFPGLETRGGTLTDSGDGKLLLKLPSVNLAAWIADPTLNLAAGDVVTFSSYQVPVGSPQSCIDLVNLESPGRFSLEIVALPAADTLKLDPLPATSTSRGFDLSSCPSGLGVVAAVRTAGDHPWLVSDGSTVRGRAKNGEAFVGTGRRFDYPLDYTADALPLASDNVAVAFKLGGPDPAPIATTVTSWTFSLSTGLDLQSFGDATLLPGQFAPIATVVTGYSSPRHQQLLFTSITGGNSVVQADPSQLLSGVLGLVVYK